MDELMAREIVNMEETKSKRIEMLRFLIHL